LGKFIASDVEDILVKKLKVEAVTNDVTDANTNPLTLEDLTSDVEIVVDGQSYDGSVIGEVITFNEDFTVNAGEVLDYEIVLTMRNRDLEDNT